jgi:hypothetical protein
MLPIVKLIREAKVDLQRQEGRRLTIGELANRSGMKSTVLARYHARGLTALRLAPHPRTVENIAVALTLPRDRVAAAFESSCTYIDRRRSAVPTAPPFELLKHMRGDEQQRAFEDFLAAAGLLPERHQPRATSPAPRAAPEK